MGRTHLGWGDAAAAVWLVSGCGGTLRSVNGSFASPGYPGNGTVAAVACTWLIEVPVRRRVTLRFTDFEVGAATAGCVESHVDVHNGATASASRVGRYCGGVSVSTAIMSPVVLW